MPAAFKIPKLYSVEETAEIMAQMIGFKSCSYVYKLIYDGVLKARLRRGTQRGYVITQEAIMDFYENGFYLNKYCQEGEEIADK